MNARGRGRGGFRGGFRGGRGAGGFSAAARDSQRHSDGSGRGFTRGATQSAETSERPAVIPQKERHVTTVLTEGGTELPKKLNNKVFIDGLPYEHKVTPGSPTLEDEVMQFAAAWKVGRPIRLIKKDGQGFGFLVFHSPHSVDVAVRVLNGRKFLGRTLRVEVPKPKDMAISEADNIRDAGKSSFARQVLLTDLAKITQPEIVREILRDVAPQLEKRLESIKMTSNNRKAFLTFMSTDDVEPAVKFLDGFSMLGRRISAAQAAAPGSLPYSKSMNHNLSHARNVGASMGADVHNSEAEHNGEAEEEEAPVLPLGVVRPPTARQEVTKRAERQPVKEGKASNITGITEKYNLLEKGPAEVYVGNLGDEVTEAQLRSHFAPCGKIASCEILVNKSTSLPTGIARIVFALPAYASYAQKHLHGSRLHGHVIRVDRGDEQSAPLASESAPHDEEEDFDEDAYMEHYGVKDKAAYFKGTSFEEEHEDRKTSKRTREKAADKTSKKSKKAKTEEFETSAFIPTGDDDDDDEEERFHDVDEVTVPAATASGKRVPKKKLAAGKKSVKRVKKASK